MNDCVGFVRSILPPVHFRQFLHTASTMISLVSLPSPPSTVRLPLHLLDYHLACECRFCVSGPNTWANRNVVNVARGVGDEHQAAEHDVADAHADPCVGLRGGEVEVEVSRAGIGGEGEDDTVVVVAIEDECGGGGVGRLGDCKRSEEKRNEKKEGTQEKSHHDSTRRRGTGRRRRYGMEVW